MAHKQPFELVPILLAGAVAAFVLYALIGLFDTGNTKTATYLGYGFLAGVTAQIGVRLAGVS